MTGYWQNSQSDSDLSLTSTGQADLWTSLFLLAKLTSEENSENQFQKAAKV